MTILLSDCVFFFAICLRLNDRCDDGVKNICANMEKGLVNTSKFVNVAIDQVACRSGYKLFWI